MNDLQKQPAPKPVKILIAPDFNGVDKSAYTRFRDTSQQAAVSGTLPDKPGEPFTGMTESYDATLEAIARRAQAEGFNAIHILGVSHVQRKVASTVRRFETKCLIAFVPFKWPEEVT